MTSPLIDTVAGDEVTGEEGEFLNPHEIVFWVQFGGGDPTRLRPKELSIRIPVLGDTHLSEYTVILQVTLREIGKLGDVAQVQVTGLPDSAVIDDLTVPKAPDMSQPVAPMDGAGA